MSKHYMILTLIILSCFMAGCVETDETFTGKTPVERLDVLQNKCSSVARRGTRLHDDPPTYLLSKICGDMDAQIRIVWKSPKEKNAEESFNKHYASCLNESKSDSSMFEYRGHHHYEYYLRAKSLCNAYKDEFTRAYSLSFKPHI